MSRLSLGRRRLLQALGLTAAARLPPFRPGVLHAQTARPVSRFVPMMMWFGVQGRDFWPKAVETDVPLRSVLPLPRSLTPLEPFVDQMTLVKGLKLASSRSPGFVHIQGSYTVYSGVDFVQGMEWNSGGGPTIDQVLAAKIGGETPFPSLQFACIPGTSAFWKGRLLPLKPMEDPAAAFKRVFGNFSQTGGDPVELEALRIERRSVFDHLSKELGGISAQLGCDDKARIDNHLTSIREIEKRLSSGGALLASCGQKLSAPPALDYKDSKIPHLIAPLQLDMIAAALACGLTRIASMQWPYGDSLRFPYPGMPDAGHHYVSHYGDGKLAGTVGTEAYHKMNLWFMEQVAYLAGKLKQIPQSDGRTLLDHTIVSLLSDCGDGTGHTITDVPAIVVGNAGGRLKTGRYLQFKNLRNQNDLLNSIYNAVAGVDDGTFGDPKYCKGPLPLS